MSPPALHHAGVVAADPDAAERLARQLALGPVTPPAADPSQGAVVRFLGPGPPYVEVVAPLGPGGPLAACAARGGGLHHLCYAVPDADAECRRMRALGMRLLRPPTPAPALAGRRVAWLVGRDRLLVELVELGHAPDPGGA